MPIRDIRDPSVEIDCLARVGDGEAVRSFLRLPSRDATGRLRMVDAHPVDTNAPSFNVELQILDGPMSIPGCLPNCFLRSMKIGIPQQHPYPIELVVNRAILGSDNPDARYESVSISSLPAREFLDRENSTPAEVINEGAVRHERASAPFGGDRLQIFEIGEQSRPEGSGVLIDWWAELVLSGEPRTLGDWADLAMRPLGLLAFCLDRPLAPERVHTIYRDSTVIDLHVGWREARAPNNTEALMTMDWLGDRFRSVGNSWGQLWIQAPELMWSIGEYQQRRNVGLQSDAFLLVARCLELFHSYSERFSSTRRPKPEHDMIVARTMSCLEPDLRAEHGKWIRTSLQNSNRASLLNQINAITGSFERDVLTSCGIGSDTAELARTMRDARNYFTHPSGGGAQKTPKGRELVVLQHRAWFLLRACILRELGLSEAEIAERLFAASQSHYLIRD